jgi:ubiquinone/menaquinone biosynthesis C-methylase UbiE
LQDFAAWCQPHADWLTLDVGCGPGLLPALLTAGSGCRSIGTDIDTALFARLHLHNQLCAADVYRLPFADQQFDLVTATNLLFLLDEPDTALAELSRLVNETGQVILLNPTEALSIAAAEQVAEQHSLQGTARQSLLSWATNAESHRRWSEAETQSLFRRAGLKMTDMVVKVGPGFARYTRGRK